MPTQPALDIWGLVRAGDIDPNPTNFASRAQQWAQSAPEGTMLLVTKQDNVLRDYIVAPRTQSSETAALALAQSVAAKVVSLTDEPDTDIAAILSTPAVTMLSFERGAMMQRDPIVGADTAEISRQLALALREGEWVALSVRKPNKKENKRYRDWIGAQLATRNPNHASQNTNAIVVSIWAGAETQGDSDARAMNLAAALRGFDVPVVPSRVTKTGQVARFSVVAAIGALFAAALPALAIAGVEVPPPLPAVLQGLLALGIVLGLVGVVGIIGTVVGFIPSFAKTVRTAISMGTLPTPRAHRGRWHRPVDQHTDRRTGNIIQATYGDYPLHPTSFLHGAEIFAGMIAPHSGADSGSTGVAERKAVAAMRECIGFRIGVNDSLAVFLSALDLRQSVSIFGRRGSGKSYITHGIYGWMSLDKLYPCGKPGYLGEQNTMISFETKSSGGAQEYVDRTMHSLGLVGDFTPEGIERMNKRAGFYKTGRDQGVDAEKLEPYRQDYENAIAYSKARKVIPRRIDIANPNGLGIDVFDLPGFTNRERAEFITSALKYVYGESSIQGHSTEVLDDIFAAAFAVDDAIVAAVNRIEPNKSPFYYASILLGSRGDDLAVELATSIRSEAARRGGDLELSDASENLDKYFVGVTQAKRQTSMEAPRNKVKNLLSMEQWWSREKRVSWAQLIEHNASVVINTAAFAGDETANVNEETTQAMSQFLLFSLKQSIERHCDGNAYRNKWVSIFSDELSMLASESSDVITWLQDKGRSYGVICVFASQRIEQLDLDVQKAVLGFGTLVVLNQLDVTVAKKIAELLSLGTNTWADADIINLEPRHAIIRTLLNDRSVPPFNVRVDDFFGDYDFAAMNGYEIGAAA